MMNFLYRYMACFISSLFFKVIIKRVSDYDQIKLNIILFIPIIFSFIGVIYVYFIFSGAFIEIFEIRNFKLRLVS